MALLRRKSTTALDELFSGSSVSGLAVSGSAPSGSALSGSVKVRIGRDDFSFSHLDRVLFPEEQLTKFDLMKYYYEVHSLLLPYLHDRPLTLRRFPTGIEGMKFYQHDLEHAPIELTRKKIWSKTENIEKNYAFANDLGDLLYLVNIGCIGFHPYLCRYDVLSMPDYVVFDLDPQEQASFDAVLEVAKAVKKKLDAVQLESYAKTSGARGLHIFVPIKRIYTFDQTSKFAKRIAEAVVKELPEKATVVRSVRARKPEHVYVDYLQNLYGKSIVAPYSVRERAGATVSMPVSWKEIEKGFAIADFTIANVRTRMKRRKDSFHSAIEGGQTLPR